MKQKITNIETFFTDGCGRCDHFATAECKARKWQVQLLKLREIIGDFPVKEELKWSQPVYTYNGKNIMILSCFKDHAFISFLEGMQFKDPEKLLSAAGPNAQHAKLYRVDTEEAIKKHDKEIRDFISQAIAVSTQEKKKQATKPLELPQELLDIFETDQEIAAAFKALTPGRQRGYVIYISGAKQAATRVSRIAKYRDKILQGKGFHD